MLVGTPLPGLGRPVQLADLALATDAEGNVRLLDDELARRVVERLDPSAGVRLVAVEDLRPAAGELVGALRLRAAALDDTVRVTVETCLRRDPAEDLHPTEQLSVELVERDGSWVVAGNPRHLAT